MSLLSSQQLSSQLLFSAGEEGLGLQTSCSVSPVYIDTPVTPPAITNSKSAASSSETSTHTSLTPVRKMMHLNPTKLKLTHPTPHNHLKPMPVNPGMPSSGSSRLSLDTTKRSPPAELVNVPKIDSQKKVKTGKARVLTSS